MQKSSVMWVRRRDNTTNNQIDMKLQLDKHVDKIVSFKSIRKPSLMKDQGQQTDDVYG